MVNYKKIVEELKKESSLSLFFVAQMDELMEAWTVIFAADWINDRNLQTVYQKISKLIDENGSRVDIAQVSRINIFNSDHYLIKGLLEYSGEQELSNVKINGNTIHYGMLFYPEPNVK